jgi:hypothetical protein
MISISVNPRARTGTEAPAVAESHGEVEGARRIVGESGGGGQNAAMIVLFRAGVVTLGMVTATVTVR